MIVDLLLEARPKQWLKNALVFAAPGAAGALDDGRTLRDSLIVFACFCLVASGTYYWNDVRDIEQDRHHPRKRHRPVASGRVPLGTARGVGTALVLAGTLSCLVVDEGTTVILASYGFLTLTYSVWWKHVPLADLAVVASGFVLRAIAGATATSTPMSDWFILCTMFGSFFIVTGKRFAELVEMADDAGSTRRSLLTYPAGFLPQLLTLACGSTLLSYCLWALENSDGSDSVVPLHSLSIVPMGLALLRYLMVLHEGKGSAPEEVFLRDRAIQVYGLVWLAIYATAVYAG